MAGETTKSIGGNQAAIGTVELCDRNFLTDGDSTYDWVDVGPIFEGLGPRIEKLYVHANCSEKSANFKYKLRSWISYNGKDWAVGEDIFTEQTAGGYFISTGYGNTAYLGRFMRFQVGVNDAGAQERGHLAFTLYWKYQT